MNRKSKGRALRVPKALKISPAQVAIKPGNRLQTLILQVVIMALALFGCLFSFLYSFQIAVNTLTLVLVNSAFLLISAGIFYWRRWYWVLPLPLALAFGWGFFCQKELVQGFWRIGNQMLQLFEANSNWSFTRFDVDAVPAFMALEQTTLAAVFLSLVLAVGIGFVVIRQCSTLGLILCTAPFLYVAMFFVIAPPLPALFCLLGAYVMVYVLQGSLKARWLPDKKQAKGQTVHEKALVQRSVALVALIAVILSAFAGVALLPEQGYERPQQIENLLQSVMSLDIGRLFSPFRSGLAKGDLRRLDNLHFVGDEVLKVKLSEDTPLYLRGWSGAVYTDSGWQAASKSGYEQAAGNFGGINPLNFYATFLQTIGTGGQAANTWTTPYEISIKNVFGDRSVVFVPNGLSTSSLPGAWFEQDSHLATSAFGGVTEYTLQAYPCMPVLQGLFFPNSLGQTPDLKEVYALDVRLNGLLEEYGSTQLSNGQTLNEFWQSILAYRQYVYDTYTALPQETLEHARQLLKQFDLQLVFNAMPGTEVSYVDLQATCEMVRRVLQQQCSYTLTPAVIPQGEDFASYFLTQSQEGYCMHFATTATLLLRALGIPARYAEGYVLTQQDLGKSRDEEGYLSVLDDKAHAWVEVYSPLQMEWIPVEMTPGYQEAMGLEPDEQTELPPAPDDTQDTVISQQPSSSASSQSQTAEESSQQPQAAQAAGLSPMAFVPAAVVLAILAIGAAVLVLWRKMALKARQKAMAQKEANALVAYSLRWVLDILRFVGAESMQPQDTPQTYAAKVKAQLDWIDQSALWEVLAIGQQARFSNRAILPSQAQKTADFAKALSIQAQNRLPAVHKLVYQYIRHLG